MNTQMDSEAIKGLTVACHSYWNNSMGFDECDAIVWLNGEFVKVSTGIDTWLNRDTSAFIALTPQLIRDAYSLKLEKADRKRRAEYLRKRLAEETRIGANCGLPRVYVRQLRRVYADDTLSAVFKLLNTKAFRSDFRRSLRDQIVNWLREKNPRFAAPLSPKQLSYLY